MNANAQPGWRPQQARIDHALRDVVDQAIAAMPEVGVQKAAQFMSAMGVPHEVAVRTLVYPQRRRTVGAAAIWWSAGAATPDN